MLATIADIGQINERLYNDIVSKINVARANVREGLFDPNVLEGPAKRFAIAYEQFKADNEMIDFPDMLLYAADLMERRPDIRERYQRRFDFIQVDEFQDVSGSDWRFIRQLGENIMAVGDDDQTIYSFRSGAGGVMQDFADTAAQYPVTENFRSRPEIVDLSSQLIGRSRKRLPKELTSMLETGGRVQYQETTPGTLMDALAEQLPEGRETAVLVPTNYEAGRLRAMLRDREELAGRVSSIHTLHGSKGLEFERVIMLLNTFERGGGLYRSFPFASGLGDMDEQLEESRRLFYVGMTRAKDELVFMGRDPKFLYELGFRTRDEISNEAIEKVSDEAVKASRNLRQRMRDSFNNFRSHYQRIRYYQDMVDMERQGRVPDMEIIENLDAAHVHREKIEELGRQLGLDPTPRTERAARLGLPDRILSSLHRPGRFAAASYGSLFTLDFTGLLGGMNYYGRKALALAPMAAAKGIRRLDEGLYPLARRPDQTINYRELHHPLPDRVRNILPEGVDPTNFRIVKPFVASEKTPYSPYLYEFPHAEEGWMGPAAERPLFHQAGFEMNRTDIEQMRKLNEAGLLTEAYADLDTTESSRNIQITPYEPLGPGTPYQPPRRPRSPEQLSQAAIEYVEDMRRHVEDSRSGPRRPSWWRRPDWRTDWERQHARLLRGPVARKGIDQFLLQNRGRNIVDFQALNTLLTRLNPDRTRVTMGARFGSQDMAGRTIALHNEVLDMLEEVWNPESPYHMPSQWVGAGGRLHDLPGGAGTATDVAPTEDIVQPPDVSGEPAPQVAPEVAVQPQAPVRAPDRVPGYRMRKIRQGIRDFARLSRDVIATGGRDPMERAQRARDAGAPGILDWFFGDDDISRSSLFLETFDEAGKRLRTGSGVYLGDGRIATALHTQIGRGERTPSWGIARTMFGTEYNAPMRSGGFVESIAETMLGTESGLGQLEIEGIVAADEARDIAILQLAEGYEDFERFLRPADMATSGRGLLSRIGLGRFSRLRTMGAGENALGQIFPNISSRGGIGRQAEEIISMIGDQFYPTQSGSGVYSRGFGFRPGRLRGIFTAGEKGRGRGYFTPVEYLRRLMGESGQRVYSYDEVDHDRMPTEAGLEAGTALRLQRGDVRDARGTVINLMRQRAGLVSDYEVDRAMQFDLDTPEGFQGYMESEIRAQRIGQIDQIVGENLEALSIPPDTDLDTFDAESLTRSRATGRRLAGTRTGSVLRAGFGAADRVIGPVGDFMRKPRQIRLGSRGLDFTWARGLSKFAKILPPGLEILDIADKVMYFTGMEQADVTRQVLEGGDINEMIERYRLLAESRAFHTGGGLGVVSNLLTSRETGLEHDLFERKGGLREIGEFPLIGGALGWAARLPGIDPLAVAWDKIERGIGGRYFAAASDPTGRLARGQIDVEIEKVSQAIQGADLTDVQRTLLVRALQTEEQALENELGAIGVYDQDAVAGQRSTLEAELARVRELPDTIVTHGDYGDPFATSGRMVRSRESVISEIEGKIAQLPSAREETIRTRLAGVREQIGGLGYVEPRIRRGLRVALPTPPVGGFAPIAEQAPVVAEEPVSRVIPYFGAVTPRTFPAPVAPSITPDATRVIEGRGIVVAPAVPLTPLEPTVAPVVPLTEQLQPGVRRSLQYARIMEAELEATGTPTPMLEPIVVEDTRLPTIPTLEPIVVEDTRLPEAVSPDFMYGRAGYMPPIQYLLPAVDPSTQQGGGFAEIPGLPQMVYSDTQAGIGAVPSIPRIAPIVVEGTRLPTAPTTPRIAPIVVEGTRLPVPESVVPATQVGEAGAEVLPLDEPIIAPTEQVVVPSVDEPLVPDTAVSSIGPVVPLTRYDPEARQAYESEGAYMVVPHLDFDLSRADRYRKSQYGFSPEQGKYVTMAEFKDKSPASPDGKTYVLDGDTLKGLLYAPKLGIMGEERVIRYKGIDTAEFEPESKRKYLYSKGRTQDQYDTEHGRALDAWQMHVEAIKGLAINQGRTEDFIVPFATLRGDEDAYGRLLGTPDLGTLYEDFIDAKVGRVTGSSADFGQPSIGENTLRATKEQMEKARKYLGDIPDMRIKELRAREKESILAPVDVFKRELAGMTDTYTGAMLTDPGTGFIERITTERDKALAIGGGYTQAADKLRGALEEKRAEYELGPEETPSYQEYEVLKGIEDRIKLAEESAKAHERAATAYQRILNQSNKLVERLEKQVHQSQLAGIKDQQQYTLQQTAELATALQESVKAHTDIRKSMPQSVLSDTDFVRQFEGDFAEGLQDQRPGISGELETIRTQVAAQEGLTETARTAWQEASAAFENDPGVESGERLRLATESYNAEKRQLQHLQRMEGVLEKKLGILEAGLSASEASTLASEQIAHKLQLQEQKLDAAGTVEYAAGVAEGMIARFEGVSEQGVELTGGPLQADMLRAENLRGELDSFMPTYTFADSFLDKQIDTATDRVEGLQTGLEA